MSVAKNRDLRTATRQLGGIMTRRSHLHHYRIPNAGRICYFDVRAVEVVEGVTVRSVSRERSTMIIIGIILGFVGLGFLGWLLFALAVHALPTFVGLSAGFAAYSSGSGEIGAIVVGVIAAGLTFVAAHIAVATFRSPLIRSAIAMLFAVPASMAGYHAVLGLARLVVPAELWQQAFALIGALAAGGAAWARLALSMPPGSGPEDRVERQSPLSAVSDCKGR
jgi:hypothetical protein